MALVAVDHVETSTALIPPEQKKPNFLALASTILAAVTTLDTELVGLSEGLTDPSQAVGVQLDNLARIVGAPIVSDPAIQRLFIETQVLVNKSDGSAEVILEIANILDPGLVYKELYPAFFELATLFSQTEEFATAAAGQIFSAKSASVGSSFFYSLVAEADTFAFSSTAAIEIDAARGFSDTSQLVGGQLAGVTTTT